MVGDDRTDLGGIELLSGLDPEALRDLKKRCRWYRFAANQIILDHGDHAKHDIYFVIKGTVRIVNYAASGREIAFANVHEGNYFGELAAITDNPRSASVVAVTECRLASLAPREFQSLLLDNPELGVQVIMRLADIVLRCDKRIMDLSTLTAVQRVHVELLHLAKPDTVVPGIWVVQPLPKYSEIASRATTTRETVSRAMIQLAVAGVVERKGKTLYVCDHERLTELAEGGAALMLAAR